MNTVINQSPTLKYPQHKYQNPSFQSKNNSQSSKYENNSTRNILISSLIALSSLVTPSINATSNNQINTNTTNDIEIVTSTDTLKSKSASELNLKSTPNENIYFDKENNIYYSWDTKKQKFKKIKQTKMNKKISLII